MKFPNILPSFLGGGNTSRGRSESLLLLVSFILELLTLLEHSSCGHALPLAPDLPQKRDRQGVKLNSRLKVHGGGEKCPELRHCKCKTKSKGTALDITCEDVTADQLFVSTNVICYADNMM